MASWGLSCLLLRKCTALIDRDEVFPSAFEGTYTFIGVMKSSLVQNFDCMLLNALSTNTLLLSKSVSAALKRGKNIQKPRRSYACLAWSLRPERALEGAAALI